MNVVRKKWVVFVLVLLTVLFSQSCNKSRQGDLVQEGSSEITIQFWNAFTGSDGDILREIVERFNQENNKGITIEMDIMPGGTLIEKLAPAIATNTAPDLILAPNTDVPLYGQNGNMLPLDNFFTLMDVDTHDFMPAVLDGLQYNGTQVMIPMQWFTQYLYYNKDVFEQAGLDPNRPPKNWNEVKNFAGQITNKEKNIYGLGLGVSGAIPWFNSLFLSNGGDIIDEVNMVSLLNSEENLQTLSFIQDMFFLGYAPKGSTGADLDNLMMADRLGMVVNGPWMVNGLKENDINFGVASFPAGRETTASVIEIIGFCIPKGTDKQSIMAAYEFIKYWNTTEVGKEWSLRNGFPPYLYSVAAEPEIQEDEIISVFAQISETGVPFAPSVIASSQIVGDVLFPMIESVGAGGDPISELEKASLSINNILAIE